MFPKLDEIWVDSLDANDAYIRLVVFEFNGISDGNSNEELSLLRLCASDLVVVPLIGRPTINMYYSHFKIYGIIFNSTRRFMFH